MKYNQPFDQTDPNAPYQNGNPATGTDGSIPPAESIEFPQREIVNVISWAFSHGYVDSTGALCAAPTNADLEQLRKAIQGMIKAEIGIVGGALKANAFSYINPATGSDTAFDGSQATVSGSKGPFATIQRGITEMTKYNLNGFTYSIICANGTYSQQAIALQPQNGSGSVALVGNRGSPSSCVISSTLGSCLILAGAGGNYSIDGFRLVAQGSPRSGDQNACIWVNGQSSMVMGTGAVVEFAATANNAPHIVLQNGGSMFNIGNTRIAGGASSHIYATDGIYTNGQPAQAVMNIVAASAFSSAFILIDTLGQVYGNFASISGAGSVTGKQYNVSSNGVLQWGTAGGGATPPGTIAGTTSTGGQAIAF